jgi:pyruvate/2-oxoacid:ferredoxin oxidoreductase alpha subunit
MVLTGNAAAAHAVRLCRPDVISGYPITPQTELWDVLYRMAADGELDCETVEPEGEHSVMSIIMGASTAGARTFTATAAQGLFFMFEPYISVANQRLPVVMVNANRESLPPITVSGSGQDIMMVKETGWIQLHTESCQEIIDTIIMAYRLAEDPEILLPVTVAYDGYYLSYRSEPVDIPPQERVDQFLPRRPRVTLDPRTPLTMGPWATMELFTEYRIKHLKALSRARTRLEEIETEFKQKFGRSYGGQIEEYRCEDADIVLVSLGSCIGTARVIVDQKRDEGVKVGLIKVRMFRPFPKERLARALRGKKAIGVVDRNINFGWQCGHMLVELKAALMNSFDGKVPMVNFIGGLNGGDITLEHMRRVVDTMQLAAAGKSCPEVTFLELE